MMKKYFALLCALLMSAQPAAANDYFTASGVPATGAALSSSLMRGEFTSIQAGFDKLPTLVANRIVHVNSGATALTSTSGFTFDGTTLLAGAIRTTDRFKATAASSGPWGSLGGSTGFEISANNTYGLLLQGIGGTNDISLYNKNLAAVMSVPTGTQTANFAGAVNVTGVLTASSTLVANSSLQSSAATLTGGTINNIAIGGSTPAAGAFTTLSTTGAATLASGSSTGSFTANTFASSGATLTGGSINNMAIGGSTPAAAAVTTLAVTGQVRTPGTSTPTCSSNCGTSPTVVGSDSAMLVTMGATGTPASGWVITFANAWASPPACVSRSAKAGMVSTSQVIVNASTTTTLTMTTSSTPPLNGDMYAIHCIGVS